jgi:hypothetical protein
MLSSFVAAEHVPFDPEPRFEPMDVGAPAGSEVLDVADPTLGGEDNKCGGLGFRSFPRNF